MSEHKSNIRAAMRDGMPPSRAVKVAHEMRRQAEASASREQGPEPEMDLGDPEEDVTHDTFAHGGVGGRLSYEHRAHMRSSEFALPGKREGGKGGYPIPDVSHARNALARVAQHGTPAQQREVRAKVHSKFPSVGRD